MSRAVTLGLLVGVEAILRRWGPLVDEGAPKEKPKTFHRVVVGSLGAMATLENLLERESELGELELALQRTLEGEGRCVVIEGAAGIGKTSLLRAVRDQAAARALRVLRARGTELEQTLPYGIVRQLFERTVVRASPEERADALAGAAEHAAPVLEGRSASPAAAVDGDSAFAVLHGLYWLAANLAERQPLVIAIDDLHWADAASISWLAYLAHRIDGLPLL